MENKAISETLVLLADLKELFGEDPFRISSVRNAARKISKLSERLEELNLSQLQELEGIGKSMAKTITEINQTGKVKELEDLKSRTPTGVIKMLNIPGIGPKKVNIIWNTLGLESISELRYACNENRLIEAKGFGIKTQNEILKNLDYFEENEGLFLYPKLMNLAAIWENSLKSLKPFNKSIIVGDLRRRMEYSDRIEILVGLENLNPENYAYLNQWVDEQKVQSDFLDSDFKPVLIPHPFYQNVFEIKFLLVQGVSIYLYFIQEKEFSYYNFLFTGSQEFIDSLDKEKIKNLKESPSELEIFKSLGMDYLEPELRENWEEVFKGLIKGTDQENSIISPTSYYPSPSPSLIQYSDLKGALHNHSTYSDGIHTLKEMAEECQKIGLEYFGICDHSKTAVYANGLSIERVQEQQIEIDKLNQSYQGFRIFKGIESDILNDGSLDYPDEVLKTFDFVVASVHSNLKMDKSKAMTRVMKAIENPYTTILGHPTGRLLLGRSGYPLDMEIIIEACVKNHVVIEINANPNRLDIDWRFIHLGMEKGVKFSINPDAHKREGLKDMEYGIGVSRKAGLDRESCLNTMNLTEIEVFFKQRKKLRQTV